MSRYQFVGYRLMVIIENKASQMGKGACWDNGIQIPRTFIMIDGKRSEGDGEGSRIFYYFCRGFAKAIIMNAIFWVGC
jgi:hypothetical protein